MNKSFYHGTDLKGLTCILRDELICAKYGEEYGCYLSDSKDIAGNFGNYIINIQGVDESLLAQDEINDGFYYKKGLVLFEHEYTISIIDCQRTRMDAYSRIELELRCVCFDDNSKEAVNRLMKELIEKEYGENGYIAYRRIYPEF